MKARWPSTSPLASQRTSFANHVHRLVPVNCVQRTVDRTEAETRGNALLDEPVILLDYIVQIGTPPPAASSTELSVLLQLRHRVRVALVAVYIDDPGTNLRAASQRQLQKELGCDCIALRR